MTLGDHLEELRRRLLRAVLAVVVGMVVCFFLGKHILQILFLPLAVATGGRPPNLYYHALPEGFSTFLRVSLISGAVLASPYALYQMWLFIAAGLYQRERQTVRRYLLPSVVLFILGVAFFLFVVAPLVTGFFLHFAQSRYPTPPTWDWLSRYLGRDDLAAATTQPAEAGTFVQPLLAVGEYISFVALLSLVFGLGFQTPLVVLFLGRSGIVSVQRMRRVRRYVFLIICIVSAIVTPADVGSMVALAVPMYLLYEIGLFAAARKRRED